MIERAPRPERVPGRMAYAIGFAVTLAMLVVAHQHPVWRPWLGGIVTEKWPEVMWAVDLSLGAQLAGQALLFVSNPAWLRRLVDLVGTVLGGLSLAVALTVYPFDFGGLNGLVRVVMGVVLFAVGIAAVVNLGRLVTTPWGPTVRRPGAGHADVLVAYASKHGATADIARRVGEVLRRSGLSVDVRPVEEVDDPTCYGAVVLGSAVYYGGWRPTARRFLKAHERALAGRPVWLFSSGPTGVGDPKALADGWTFPAALRPFADRVAPRDVALFCGALDPATLGPFERWVIRNVKAPTGDFRDWEAIEAWAHSIARSLKPPLAAAG